MEKFIQAEQTKNGHWALWEQGGKSEAGCYSLVVAKQDGTKPKTVYRQVGKLYANGKHALIVIHKGYYVIEAVQTNGNLIVYIFRVEKIFSDGKVKLTLKNSRLGVVWERGFSPRFSAAVQAAAAKANCQDCSGIFYAVRALY